MEVERRSQAAADAQSHVSRASRASRVSKAQSVAQSQRSMKRKSNTFWLFPQFHSLCRKSDPLN